ncbi:MAG: hypothetical protein ACK559_12635, partial [bacterium]
VVVVAVVAREVDLDVIAQAVAVAVAELAVAVAARLLAAVRDEVAVEVDQVAGDDLAVVDLAVVVAVGRPLIDRGGRGVAVQVVPLAVVAEAVRGGALVGVVRAAAEPVRVA